MIKDPAEDARTAADMAPDVAADQIGAIYAEGLLAATEQAGPDTTDRVLADFDAVATEILDVHPAFEQLLASGLIAHEDKVGMLDRTLAARISPVLLNFLKVVSKHERLDVLRAIHRQCHDQLDQLRGRVRVRLTTVEPLDSAQRDRIAAALDKMLDGEVVMEAVTDDRLIGGAVLRLGDIVMDGSVADQLKRLRQQIIDRSVHEIQG